LALRLILGVVVLSHGVQKLFGWFGGFGFDGTVNFFTQSIGIPYPFAVLIILAETFGMLLLILGIFGRYLAGSIIVIMAGAIITIHGANGFYMNWSGNLAGEGFEYHLLAIGLALALAMNGTGSYSLDRFLFKRKGHEAPDSFSVRQ
jgi:putative oxidoreductase